MEISHCYWHLVVKNGYFTLLLTSSGQEWQFHITTNISWSRNWNSTFLSLDVIRKLKSSGQEWQFHIATDIWWRRWTISHCYWHLVVKNWNFTFILTSSGEDGQFHIATDILSSRMAISHCYWHLVIKNGNLTLLLTSSGEDGQFYIAIDM